MSVASINGSYLMAGNNITSQVQKILANGSSSSGTATVSTASACTDGSDDGKVGLWESLKNIGKGVWNMGVNMVKGALQHPLKTAALIGACLIPGIGPVIATALSAYGAVTGGVSLLKNGYTALFGSSTDAEAKAAWQNVGGAALQTGISVLGLKASLKGIAKNNGVNATGVKDSLANIKETGVIQTLKNSWGVFKASKLGTSLTEIGSTFKNNGFKEGFKEIGNQLKTNTKFGQSFAKGWNASKSTSKVGQFVDGVKNMVKEGAARFKENQLQRKMAKDVKKGTNKTETQCQKQIDSLDKQVKSYKTETIDGKTVYKKGNTTFESQQAWEASKANAQSQLTAAQEQLTMVQETMAQTRGNVVQSSKTTMDGYRYDSATKKWTDSAGKEVADRATISKLDAARKTADQTVKAQAQQLNDHIHNYDRKAELRQSYRDGYRGNTTADAKSVIGNYEHGITGGLSNFTYNFSQAAEGTGVGTFGTVAAGMAPQAEQLYTDEELAALGIKYSTGVTGSSGFVYNPYLGIA